MTYKSGSKDPVVLYKNGGWGLNFRNAGLMLKIIKKIERMKRLDDLERKQRQQNHVE
jgi:hypothetical protein